ncbi:MAG TPA: hypothetical protein PKC69_11455 [Chitinophagaceae bacterium]|nr:hypothetical protein [Chitinophagaceae bacterium]
MRRIIYSIAGVAAMLALTACEKKDYPKGLPEYEHHYYIVHVPNNNTTKISVNRDQPGLVKLPVQFYSSYTRNYDAVAHYSLVTTGIAAPAVPGQDFQVVDKNGNTLAPEGGKYSMIFPKAEQAKDTIYLKLLNSSVPGTRSVEIHLLENQAQEFYVDIFSTAFRKTVEIK